MNNPDKVTTDELALTNMVQIEALTRLGIEKGLWTHEEFTETMQKVAREFQNRRGEKN